MVCINKDRHFNQYSDPEDPAILSLKLLVERIQGFAKDQNEQVFVLVDINRQEEAKQRNWLSRLLQRGSSGLGRLYGTVYEWKLQLKNVIEVHLVTVNIPLVFR